ncbi:MAG: ribonuclease HII [Flavobacteriaceae bacterium]|nr:ribonuclease HII [Flavobacteriaceae bacterium]
MKTPSVLKPYFSELIECGTDEAGRGCLAGPVTAAAVILPKDFRHPILNDSKQLSEKKRTLLRPIIEAEALAFGVAHVYPKKIDEINILNASILAMHQALDKLRLRPEFVLVDGNRFKPYHDIPHECMVKGDARFLNIAAASVLAKTYRDDFMKVLAQKYPQYQWENNKGYPTKAHRLAIQKYGATNEHRKSFQLLPNQLEIEF